MQVRIMVFDNITKFVKFKCTAENFLGSQNPQHYIRPILKATHAKLPLENDRRHNPTPKKQNHNLLWITKPPSQNS